MAEDMITISIKVVRNGETTSGTSTRRLRAGGNPKFWRQELAEHVAAQGNQLVKQFEES